MTSFHRELMQHVDSCVIFEQVWAALVLPPVTSKSEVDPVQEKSLLKSQWFSKIVTIYHQLKKVNLEIFLFSLFSSNLLRKLIFFSQFETFY